MVLALGATSWLTFSELSTTLCQCKYLIDKSAYLRIYADHTLLLEEGEVFVAMEEINQDDAAIKSVLGFRNPSYFAGDLRRWKRVDLKEIETRCQHRTAGSCSHLPEDLRRSPSQMLQFFRRVKNVVLLSVKGPRSEADKMSGGDYGK